MPYLSFHSGIVPGPVVYTNEGPGQAFRLMYGVIRFQTTINEGSRLITFRIKDDTGEEVFHTHSFVDTPRNSLEHYYLMSGIGREQHGATSEEETNANYQMSVPKDCMIPRDWSLEILDINESDPNDLFQVDLAFQF